MTGALDTGVSAVDHVDILIFPVISTELGFEMRHLRGPSGKNISGNPLDSNGFGGQIEPAPVGVILHASHGTSHAMSSDTRRRRLVKFP